MHCVSLDWLCARSSFTQLVVLTPCTLVNAIPEKIAEAVFLKIASGNEQARHRQCSALLRA